MNPGSVCMVTWAVMPSAEASHAGLTVESCTEVLTALECSLFGGTLAPSAAREAVRRAAIADAATNPQLIKR